MCHCAQIREELIHRKTKCFIEASFWHSVIILEIVHMCCSCYCSRALFTDPLICLASARIISGGPRKVGWVILRERRGGGGLSGDDRMEGVEYVKERVEAKKKSENANEDVKTGGKEEV